MRSSSSTQACAQQYADTYIAVCGHTNKHTHTHTHTHSAGVCKAVRERYTYSSMPTHPHTNTPTRSAEYTAVRGRKYSSMHTGAQYADTDRQTASQTDRQTERQTDRHTGAQQASPSRVFFSMKPLVMLKSGSIKALFRLTCMRCKPEHAIKALLRRMQLRLYTIKAHAIQAL